jgi:hypothetical protein
VFNQLSSWISSVIHSSWGLKKKKVGLKIHYATVSEKDKIK